MEDKTVKDFLRWSRVDDGIMNELSTREHARCWMQAFKNLCTDGPPLSHNFRLQDEIIHMGLLIKITVMYITEYLELCEKYLTPDAIMEIFDKHPMMQDYYMGDNKLIKTYLMIVG